MEQMDKRDEALFKALEKRKRKRKRKAIRTVVIIVLLLAAALALGVPFLRRKVAKSVTGDEKEVTSAQASIGSISTQVSGTGTLINVDEESISVPAGVAIDEITVSAGETVKEGQVLARVNSVSVLNAMDDIEDQMSSLDNEIYEASADTVDNYIQSGVEGRVKIIYAQIGDDVVACMAEHGALAVLSLDGYLDVQFPSADLVAGTGVEVRLEDGTELDGTVESVIGDTVTVLVSDDGQEPGEIVTILSEDGQMLGNGTLEIHNPLRISGTSGTIYSSSITENQRVYSGSTLFGLTDLSYYARYQTLLDERGEMEDTLLELLSLYQSGAVLAPYSGSISAVSYDEDLVVDDEATELFTISPDKSMEVSLSVDESNILSLEIGQTAQITVSSIGDDVFPGTVTEINRTATSSSGVTLYSAVVTLDKTPEMLQGMSAKVVIRIQGVDGAIIVPIDALHQTSSTSYVYTSYDEETQEFGGLVTVTVGITNSSYAEITSGLKEGDTVYYTETETPNFAAGFGGGMPGNMGGNMPGNMGNNGGGGNRPSGGGGNSSGFPGGRG